MTDPASRTVDLAATPVERGCMGPGCKNQRTVQLHPYRGRLCPAHVDLPTIPPGPYRRELALEFVDPGHLGAALAYLRAVIARDCDERFSAAAERLAAA